MNYRQYLTISDKKRRELEETRENYEKFSSDPENARPMILVFTPVQRSCTVREMTHDPRKMLQWGLDSIRAHLMTGDDAIPAVRVEFGTGQVAHAFGCGLYEPENDMPCAKNHILSSPEEAASLPLPSLTAGRFGELEEYLAFFRENAPDFVRMQIPDLQGPFNNAHLIRGNDILLDFYDAPEMVETLLQKVTDYQIALARRMKTLCAMDPDFFCDWGGWWKGSGRISNCSLHMISAGFYRQFVQKYDQQFLDAVGGGRIHYCGTHDNGLFDAFFSMRNLSGVDYDGAYHDLWELSEKAPRNLTLLQYMKPAQIERLLAGDWPKKRNIILQVSAGSAEEGKDLLRRLRESMPA